MKVLLLSHTPVTTYNNMGKTLLSLFSAFHPEELCQLYLYPSVPDTTCCGSYYRFTDRDAMHSLLDHRVTGGEVTPEPGSCAAFSNRGEERICHAPRTLTTLSRWGRDLMWSVSHWNNHSLQEWLERQAPDVLFVAPGEQELLYDIALTVAKQYSIPLVAYVCDDFYFIDDKPQILRRARQRHLRRKIAGLTGLASLVITICPELADRYRKTFGVRAETVMTCPPFRVRTYAGPVRDPDSGHMVYMGNLQFGRDRALLELGQVLDAENRTACTAHTLEIYTGENNPEVLSELSACPAVRLHDFVTGAAYEEALDGTDVFVHAESFDADYRERVRYSVSTKIIEGMASGKPLLAYGPREVASMTYLRRHHCAELALSRENLPNAVDAVLTQESLRQGLAARAGSTAKREVGGSRRLRALLEQVVRKHK